MQTFDSNIDVKLVSGPKYSAMIEKVDGLASEFCSSNCNKCSTSDVQVHHSDPNVKKTKRNNKKKLVNWGSKNSMPKIVEDLIKENNIIGTLMTTKRNYTIGTGVLLYRERWEDGKCITDVIETPDAIQDFLCKVKINSFNILSCADLIKHAQFFTEFICTKGGQIDSMKVMPAKYMRACEKNSKGRIENYLHSTKWAEKNPNNNSSNKKILCIPSYNESKEKQANKFIYHTGDPMLHNGYYFEPVWWGGRKWLILSNCIPEFHLANLTHGYTLRFHIEIPRDYFLDYSEFYTGVGWTPSQLSKKELDKCINNAKSAEDRFVEKLNKFLSGVANAGRAIITKSKWDKTLGKEYPGIKITPIKAELYDDKLLKLFEKSNQANISGQGLHPVLANIETQGKLSSGSEIRNALAAYLSTQFVNRNILLEPLEIVRKINKWDELEGMDKSVKFGFKELQILRLDEDKEGKAVQAAD